MLRAFFDVVINRRDYMGSVIAIFGTLVALNLGFGYWLSEQNENSQPQEGVVEVEEVAVEQPVAPKAAE
jgi:hypothetical protein